MEKNNKLKANSIVTTKIEMCKKEMDILRLNKKINGTAIGWALTRAVDLYINQLKIKGKIPLETDEILNQVKELYKSDTQFLEVYE